jgi:hypothetical protein
MKPSNSYTFIPRFAAFVNSQFGLFLPLTTFPLYSILAKPTYLHWLSQTEP